MTEAEWLVCDDPYLMVSVAIWKHRSNRKLRLYGCACCRRVWHLLRDPRSRRAVEVVEAYVDGKAKLKDAKAGAQAASEKLGNFNSPKYNASESSAAHAAAELVGTFPFGAANWGSGGVRAAIGNLREPEPGAREKENAAHCHLLRDIFGNPFRPVVFAPESRNDTVLALARQMYDSHDFGAMPILADALQDAGCDSDDLLAHCRGEGPHVRGCWALDLVLGKE